MVAALLAQALLSTQLRVKGPVVTVARRLAPPVARLSFVAVRLVLRLDVQHLLAAVLLRLIRLVFGVLARLRLEGPIVEGLQGEGV